MKNSHPQIQIFQQAFSNFEIFSDSLRVYDLDVQQLERGQFSAHVQQIQCGNILINRISSQRRIEARGNPPPGLVTFGVPTRRCQPFTWRSQFSSANTIQFYKPNTELEIITYPFFEAIDISIPESSLNEFLHAWQMPELDKIVNNREMLRCDPAKLEPLRAMLHQICLALDCDPLLLKQDINFQNTIKYEVPYLLARALMLPAVQADRSAPIKQNYALKKALDYIHTTPYRSASIERFCQQSGINARTLQRAFHTRYGLPPKSYSQAYHLNRVYKALTNAHASSTSITRIATKHGFSHMSQLARDYHRQFGELPSKTLNRS